MKMLRSFLIVNLFVLLIASTVNTQKDEDEWSNDFEKDNEFPLEIQEEDTTDGSGNGVNMIEDTTDNVPRLLEQPTEMANSDVILCPDLCTCSQEITNEGDKIIVDCTSKDFTSLPENIDSRVTELLFQNNKLEVVPKSISEFKNLAVINFNNNRLIDFSYGSISELPNLRVLKLANNRLLELPRDLKNGIDLNKIEELDFSGNDIREKIEASSFEHMMNLKKVIIPRESNDASEFITDICHLSRSLEVVCFETCENSSTECSAIKEEKDLNTETNNTSVLDDYDLLLPDGQIDETPIEVSREVVNDIEDYDISLTQKTVTDIPATESERTSESSPFTDEVTEGSTVSVEIATEFTTLAAESVTTETAEPEQTTTEVLLQNSRVNSRTFADNIQVQAEESPSFENKLMENSSAITDASKDSKTLQTGSFDSRIIAGVVVGLVLIIAGVVISKNWNTIRNKFKPRPIPSHLNQPGNGTTPEEVPLKDKSPA